MLSSAQTSYITWLLDWNQKKSKTKKQKKERDKFQILVLSIENDQEIILFRISA